jgi:hypothetical protein
MWRKISWSDGLSWEAFLDPSDSYFLFADFVEHTFCICTFLVAFFSATIDGRNLIFGHKLYKMCIYKMYVQQSRQTGSRNLMGPKTLPTIWGTYIKLVTKYQISAINSCSFFSATIDDRNLIFGHKLYIGTPYRGKRFLDTSDSYFLFADLLIFIHI